MDTPRDFSSPPSAIYAPNVTPLAAEWSEIQVESSRRQYKRIDTLMFRESVFCDMQPSTAILILEDHQDHIDLRFDIGRPTDLTRLVFAGNRHDRDLSSMGPRAHFLGVLSWIAAKSVQTVDDDQGGRLLERVDGRKHPLQIALRRVACAQPSRTSCAPFYACLILLDADQQRSGFHGFE
jgi:hypothetical protein